MSQAGSDVIKDFVFEDKDKDMESNDEDSDLQKQQGQGFRAEDKDLKQRPRSKKPKAKIKDIQMPLLQWQITVNWDDFNRILNILDIISSIVLLK